MQGWEGDTKEGVRMGGSARRGTKLGEGAREGVRLGGVKERVQSVEQGVQDW